MKIVTVVGARPQFIKAAALSRAIGLENGEITEVIVHTGQHFDDNMSEIFFREMQIPKPDYHLGISSMSHGAMTGRMMESLEMVLLDEKPDYLVVYGDTNSTLAGALAAKKLHIPVVHIEAGLRSFNNRMPEEINRILTDRISNLLFCPTVAAYQNLVKEGFEHFEGRVHRVGDVMEDAVLFYKKFAPEKSNILELHGLEKDKFILGTVHRAENTDDPERLSAIINALNKLHQLTEIVIPLHPRTKQKINDQDLKPTFKVVDPVGYFDMLTLIMNSRLVMTDSGGLQKEAYINNKYCITMRDETEWVELVEGGYNKVVGANEDLIIQVAKDFMQSEFVKKSQLYGGGTAAQEIVACIKDDYKHNRNHSTLS